MKQLRLVFYFVVIVTMTACSAGISLYSPQEQAQLGQQLDKEIRSNPKEYPIDKNDAAVRDYIDKKIFRPIVESPAIKYRGVFPYKLEIIHKDSVINAFATPGGYIYVYTGLLKYIDSEAALAGILAHEIAHAENEHASKRMFDAMGVQLLAGLVVNEKSPQWQQIVAGLTANGWIMKNSRSDEDQADRNSFDYLKNTRFYPGGVKFMFEKMRDDGAIDPGTTGNQNVVGTALKKFEGLFSSHPDPIKRIDVINQNIKDSGLPLKTYKNSDKDIFKAEYDKNIKKKLR